MAQELVPKEGQPPLAIDEIIGRLRASFKHVKLDAEGARRECAAFIERTTSALAQGAWWATAEKLERRKRELGQTVNVTLADDETTYVCFTLSPEAEWIFIGFEGGEHEEAAMPLCERLEKVLDYEMGTV